MIVGITASQMNGGGGFSPDSIPNMTVWIEADALGLSNNDPVSLWPDLSSGGNDFTQSGSARPLYKTAGPNGLPFVDADGVNDNLLAADAPSLMFTEDGITQVYILKRNNGADVFFSGHYASGFGYGLRIYASGDNRIVFFQDQPGAAFWSEGAGAADTNWHIVIVRRSNGLLTVMLDGIAIGSASYDNNLSPYITNSDANTALELFSFNGGNFANAGLYGVLGYETAVTPIQAQQLFNFYGTKCGIPVTTSDEDYILFDGNSLVEGTGSTPAPPGGGNDMPAQVMAAFGAGWTHDNIGISGQTTAQMIQNFSANVQMRIQGHLNHSGEHNIHFAWEGINSIAAGQTPAQAVDTMKDYCTFVKRMFPAVPIVVGTVLPSTGGVPPGFEANRLAYNVLMNAVPLDGTYWDAVSPLGENAIIGNVANCTDPLYYVDGTHLTNLGYSIAATVVKSTIDTLL